MPDIVFASKKGRSVTPLFHVRPKMIVSNFKLDCLLIKRWGSSPKELIYMKDSRSPGVQDSSDMLKLRGEIGNVERMLKALIKSPESKHLNP